MRIFPVIYCGGGRFGVYPFPLALRVSPAGEYEARGCFRCGGSFSNSFGWGGSK